MLLVFVFYIREVGSREDIVVLVGGVKNSEEKIRIYDGGEIGAWEKIEDVVMDGKKEGGGEGFWGFWGA